MAQTDIISAAELNNPVGSFKLVPNVRFSIRLTAGILTCIALYFAKSLLMPILLAIVLAMTFSPIVQGLRRLHIPSALGAGLLLLIFMSAVSISGIYLADPLSKLVDEAPSIARKLSERLAVLDGPLQKLNLMTTEVGKLTTDSESNKVQEVVVKAPSLISRAADNIQVFLGTTVLTVILTFLLLTSRDMIFTKVIKAIPKLSNKKQALRIAKDIESDVSRYLLTVAVINSILGLFIGFSFWVIGVPNPALWGVIAGLLNFLPYIGSGLGIIAAAAVAIISFPTLGTAVVVPLVYLFITTLEGQIFTPMILGRRFSLNTVIIIVSLAFWGFLWGPIGVFIAVPVLIIFRAMCEHIQCLSGIGEFVSGEDIQLE